MSRLLTVCLLMASATALSAQAPTPTTPPGPSAPEPGRGNRTGRTGAPTAPGTPAPAPRAEGGSATGDAAALEKPVVTRHSITLDGKPFAYTATAGMLPLKSAAGETQASIFFMAYTADGPEKGKKGAGAPAKRPLLFSFNGGPGSSSVWLHLGAIGPRRVDLPPDGQMPPPPYRVVDNESTWLDKADVVFIDPVGTGYSQATKPEENRRYWGVQEDIESIGEFIRLYLTRYDRWDSPLFLVGESYGTFRAAGLAQYLLDNGIALNGVLLISTTLNMGRLSASADNGIGYALFLPTFASTAWYHKRLPVDLQAKPLPALLEEVEAWALSEYVEALAKGNRLNPEARRDIVDRLVRYTSLPRNVIETADMRVSEGLFFKEFLRDERRILGRYDTRYTGDDTAMGSTRAEYDPSYAVVYPPFTMAFNTYIRDELGFKLDREYGILENVWPWNYGPGQQGSASTSDDLRQALTQNPYMRLFVAEGVFDLATPYFVTEYTLDHMELTPAMRNRITTARFQAGHMMYTDSAERRKLKQDAAAFFATALTAKPAPATVRLGR